MIDLSQARLAALAVHKVGQKIREEGVVASEELFQPDEILQGVLEDYFLKSFKNDFFWQFTHDTNLNLNEVYTYVKTIFAEKRSGLLEESINILKHLYAQSTHPMVKPGELYVAYFTDCQIQDQTLDAVGIFKSENKEVYLKFGEEGPGLGLGFEQGINPNKLDKGALIFNSFEDDGYSLLMVDRSSEEAQYWRDDFLHAIRLQDDSFRTLGYLDMCQDFCETIITTTESHKDQLVFMNQSLEYFSKNKAFDPEDFKSSVLNQRPEYQEAFDIFQGNYETEFEVKLEEGFEISKQAVREAKRKFKSFIRLDTGVEIRISPKADGDFIERGFEEHRGMGYYKIYFNTES